MKKQTTVLILALCGFLALMAGCGKTENASPATKQASQPAASVKAEPPPAEKPLAETANTKATDVARTISDAAVKQAASKLPDDNSSTAGKPQGAVAQSPTSLADLSQAQIVQGLQAALAKGLQQAVARLGHSGGFLTNLNVKIPLPEQMQKVETTLRAMKQEKLADEFITTMNRAAEQAVPEAGAVFADALTQMTINDAKALLSGSNNAATLYFQKTTQTNLYAKFYPIVQKATGQTGVTAAYKNMMAKLNVGQGLGGLGNTPGATLLSKDSLDIDAYVTNKALDGLFKIIAEEEQQIRQNPAARTTDMLQKVFGAFKN